MALGLLGWEHRAMFLIDIGPESECCGDLRRDARSLPELEWFCVFEGVLMQAEEDGIVFFRESCFRQSGDKARQV